MSIMYTNMLFKVYACNLYIEAVEAESVCVYILIKFFA